MNQVCERGNPGESAPAVTEVLAGRWLRLAWVLGVCWLVPVLPGKAERVGSHEELQARIDRHLSQSRFAGALWGVHVESLDSGRILFQRNSDQRLRPASNAKLFTAALALELLGPDHCIRTRILAEFPPDASGTIAGDLVVLGGGDFSMSARFHGGEAGRALERIVQAIRQAGIRTVQGDLVGDGTWFYGPAQGPGWAWEDLRHAYGAEVSALILEDNIIEFLIEPSDNVGQPCTVSSLSAANYIEVINRTTTVEMGQPPWIELHRAVGVNRVQLAGELPYGGGTRRHAIPVHDPALWFATCLKDAMNRRGMRVHGEARAIDWLESPAERRIRRPFTEVTAVDSPPLRELGRPMMKASQNLYAQALWLHLGATMGSRLRDASLTQTPARLAPRMTTTQAAASALREFLGTLGIPPGEVLLEEGSGLSRRAMVTPRAIIQLLAHMNHHPQGAIFRDWLPVAGQDGNLEERMRGTAAEGNVAAKTGMLANTFTLSGYVRTAAGENLAFAILLNHHIADSLGDAYADLDFIPILLASFQESLEAGR
jgi:serine-type D-Ala-D-Ala carboxypeptidase/endopeptidase (penicillin-binding protein 4)